jgi:hypothetical protein
VRVDGGQRVRFEGPSGMLEIVVDVARPGFVSPISCGEGSDPRPYVISR